ncbi:MAG: hypothetical protein N2316_07030 [Spirochaetes bacterium]|nr:hypothetical protein [Spirochaetota bacterium]
MKSILVFLKAYGAAVFAFACAAIVLRLQAKRLLGIRMGMRTYAERKREGVIGLLIVVSVALAVLPCAYAIANAFECAEAVVILYLLLLPPLVWVSRHALLHSLCMIFCKNDFQKGRDKFDG